MITGIAYPAVVTAIGQAVFPHQANGNLIEKNGKRVGSELKGQQFDVPYYYWGRLSATSPNPYNAQNSGGSNLGQPNPAPVPVDLVASSGSGRVAGSATRRASFSRATRRAPLARTRQRSQGCLPAT